MGIKELQLMSESHHNTILTSLHQLRTQGQLCDVTVQVDYEGDVQEFQAHQVMLAASSGYFKNILLSPDAIRDKLPLSNIKFSDFSRFLDFVYTGKVEIDRSNIGDVQAVAQLLDCESLSEVCGKALDAGVAQNTQTAKGVPKDKTGEEACGDKKEETEQKRTRSSPLQLQHAPQSSEKEKVPAKRMKVKNIKKKKKRVKKLKLKVAGRKMLQRRLYYSSNENLHSENQGNGSVAEENRTGDEAQSDEEKGEGEEASLTGSPSNLHDWDCEEDVPSVDSHESLFILGEGEEEEVKEEQSQEKPHKTSKAQFHCNECQRTFYYEKSYLKHISTYHGVKADFVYRCETCQQTFANRSNLKIHEKHVHSNERLYECSQCDKTFKRKKDVVRHTKQVHERIMQHLCLICGKALSSKAALSLHERTHTGTKPYECPECKARFTQNSALKMHRRTHTGEKPFACDECDARFTQKHMLAYHKRSHTGEKPYMCEACGKSFASKEYLRYHSNIHTGSKPYKCNQCDRGFAQRNSLNQHLKTHTGERPYSCKDCEKQFTQLNALQRHQRIHTGEKPYMCGLCKRTFTDKSTLRRHTQIHNSDAPWKTHLVVLEGNVEEKKSPSKEKAEPEKKRTTRKGSDTVPDVSVSAPGTSSAAVDAAAGTTQTETTVVSTEPITLPSGWASQAAIALVSHGGITLFHSEVPAGIQPMVANGTGARIISLGGSTIPVPFSIPVSQSVTLSSEGSSTSLSLPTLSLPDSDGVLASVTDISTVSTSSVIEAAASQTILASPVENTTLTQTSTSDYNIVIIDDQIIEKEQTAVVQSEEQNETAADSSVEAKNLADRETM
uniref:Heterogeneous nuclear ribonucleoprotein A0, like n=1 Tax=Iconisemion striatum TaxID=60296 RepID=A0A1A7Z579_9TELE